MVNKPLIRLFLGGGSFGGGTLDSHEICPMSEPSTVCSLSRLPTHFLQSLLDVSLNYVAIVRAIAHTHLEATNIAYPICSMGLEYLPTFTINLSQM